MSGQSASEERVFDERTFVSQALFACVLSTRSGQFLVHVFRYRCLTWRRRDPYTVRHGTSDQHAATQHPRVHREQIRERGYPPSVREIGEAVGLTSPSTVHTHLNTLQRLGYLRRDPTKPRAIEVRYDTNTGAVMERRPVRHVPLVGDVAAGTDVLAQENVEELLPVPVDFTGDGELFMLRVRGESMIELGILDGDFVVATQINHPQQRRHRRRRHPRRRGDDQDLQPHGAEVTLTPANSTMEPMTFTADHVEIYGKVVTVMRRY